MKFSSKLNLAFAAFVATVSCQTASANYDQVDRTTFNKVAAELNAPLFWRQGETASMITPEQLRVLWGMPDNERQLWVRDDVFTDKFAKVYQKIVDVALHGYDESSLELSEKLRRQTVRAELAQGRPTLIETDLTTATKAEREVIAKILDAATLIEKIYAHQTGSYLASEQMQDTDAASKMLFFRNQGPWCVAPGTEGDENCHATKDKMNKTSGLYPEELQQAGFCDSLAKADNAKALMDPFTVVKGSADKLRAVSFASEYAEFMQPISDKLQQAADLLTDPKEQAFKNYLEAAAKAFLDNNWLPADEAWAKMNALNSKWFLRIGPDEVYYDPCNLKAGFHVSFARINPASVVWQEKLDPLKSEMEQLIAQKAGKPYQAREVNFHLPDFIDIILNAGNSRNAHGATIGQSLPNWGPVANEGRGRTVAMTNLYTDDDSKKAKYTQASSLLCSDTMVSYNMNDDSVLTTLLHEAAHNLGPAHEYTVDGKTDRQLFGGPLASMLEELKAQTAANFYTDWLVGKQLITADEAKTSHVMDLVWNFGHIAQGMYDGDHKGKPYSQLSAIQVGYMLKHHGITWHGQQLAANNTDKGCFSVNQKQLPEVLSSMIELTAGIKARGDKAEARQLQASYVDDHGVMAQHRQRIAERWLRAPKASFVYALAGE